MLNYGENDRSKTREELTIEWIVQSVGVSNGAVSKIIKATKSKNMVATEPKPGNRAQICYGICWHESLFEIFRSVTGEYSRQLQPNDVDFFSAKVMA